MRFLAVFLLMSLILGGTAIAPASDFPGYTAATVCDSEKSLEEYPDFAKAGELSLLVPGLKEDWIPQGITWLEEQGWFLFAGYHTDEHMASALIAVDAESGAVVKSVRLRNMDGSLYTGHAGGVCATGKDIYVANNHRLYRLSMDKFLSLPEQAYCAFEQEIPVPNNASYCSYADGVLWVGEFQYGTSYKTDASHRLRLGKDTMQAWLCGYILQDGEFSEHALSVGSPAVPDVIFETTERIQGMTMQKGRVWLSQSYGRKTPSILYRFDDPRSQEPDMYTTVSGQEVPVWFLLNDRLAGMMICPPMTECLCTAHDEVYVLFESAAQKYMDPSNASTSPMDRIVRIK